MGQGKMSSAISIPQYDFFHPAIGDYISRLDEPAARWIESYRECGAAELEARSTHALQLLRSRNLAEGRSELDRIEDGLPSLFALDRSIGCIVSRWLYSVTAYHHYLSRRFDEAEGHLDKADMAIQSAISLSDFLLPYAHHCVDFRLQKARIARERQQWLVMRDHLDAVRGMNEDTVPLCTLHDGRDVRLTQVAGFYLSLDLDERDCHILRSLLDNELRLLMTKRALRLFYTQQGPVIVY